MSEKDHLGDDKVVEVSFENGCKVVRLETTDNRLESLYQELSNCIYESSEEHGFSTAAIVGVLEMLKQELLLNSLEFIDE